MDYREIPIKLDFNSSQKLILDKELVQCDTMNIFNIQLMKGILPYNLTGITSVHIIFYKSDNTTVQGDCQIINASTGLVKYQLGTNEIAKEGEVTVTVNVKDNTINKLTFSEFSFKVRKDRENEAVQSTTEFPLLINLKNWAGQFDYKGTYNNTTSYKKNNMVFYNDVFYINLADCVGVLPTNVTYWQDLFSVQEVIAYTEEQANYAKTQGDYANTQWQRVQQFDNKGTYSNITTYYPLNLVKYQGVYYLNKVSCVGVLPADKTKWQILVDNDKFVGDFSYSQTYVEREVVYFGIESSVYECIKPTTAGISPYNTEYWLKRYSVADAIQNAFDYISDSTSLYVAWDNGVQITHNLNAYVDCVAVLTSGLGYGASSYGRFGYSDTAAQYQVLTRCEYINMNTVKVYFEEQYTGTPTIASIDSTTFTASFADEGVVLRLKLRTF